MKNLNELDIEIAAFEQYFERVECRDNRDHHNHREHRRFMQQNKRRRNRDRKRQWEV